MPLNRDQLYSRNLPPSRASPPVVDHYLDPSAHNTGFASREHNNLQDESTEHTWREQGKNVRPTQDLQRHKLPLPVMNFEKSKHNRSLPSTTDQNLASRHSGTAEVRSSWKSKRSSHIPANAFDDTESFNQSELDRGDAEEVTAVLRLDLDVDTHQQELSRIGQNILLYPVQETVKARTQNKISSHGLQDNLESLSPKDEMNGQAQRLIPEVGRPTEPLTIPDDDYFDIEMDTPSRIQAVTRPGIILGAKKKVGFVRDAEVFGNSIGSPFVQSAELAREPSPNLHMVQISQGRAPGEGALHDSGKQREVILHDRPKNVPATLGPTSSRFTKIQQHKSHVLQQSNKVSAPDSDVPESSDDEQTHILPQGNEGVETFVSPTRKRPHDWNAKSEYSLEDMRHKMLSDFQEEIFLRSPRVTSRTLDDTDQHETSLVLRLLKLQEYTEDEKRKIFRAQNDEEWVETGQWFVDKFQEDLRKLMAVRLERRKIALKYEDKLRRRQREVELAQSDVEKELRELESGGGELIRNRKAPSRASTPMKLQ